MSIETLLFLVLIVLLVGAIPNWNYSRGWGYGPSAVLGVLLVGFLIWAFATERPLFRSGSGSSIGADIKDAVNDGARETKELGRDVADSVKDATN